MLKVTMLQTPRIELDGEVLSLPFKRADALLYYMLVQRSATRQELIALLWEGCDEATGLKNLRNALYTLKKTLGGDLLLSPQKSLVVLNEEWDIESDYDRFVHRGELAAYKGSFLQGFAVKRAFSYDEWLSRTRERLRERYLGELGQRARDAHGAGDERAAVRWARSYLMEEPYDEGMASFLMERYREGKKFPAAAQVYQKLKDCLSQELGVAPQESTTLLYYEIMNQWNDNSAEADDKALGRWVPVGREAEFAALRAALSSFAAGANLRCSQLLQGETGSGKTELIGQLLGRSDLSELLVLRSACLFSEVDKPRAAWERLLLPLRDFARGEGIADAGFERPEELFTAVSRRKRILLVLEDLQWADEESVRLLGQLLRGTESGSVMAVLSSRLIMPPYVRSSLESLRADELLHVRRLRPFTREQTAELLRSELGGEAAEKLTESFYSQTGGNLRLLRELAGAYSRHGNLNASLEHMADVLLDRLRRLSAEGTQVMQCITVFSESAPYGALLEMMGRDDRRLGAGLEELRQLGVVEELRGEETGYAFIHARMRELSYERLPLLRRRTLHRQAAEALSRGEMPRESDLCRTIAGHFRLAEERTQALRWQVEALSLDTARSCEPFSIYGGESLPRRSIAALEEELQTLLRELAQLRRSGTSGLERLEQQLTLCRGRLALYRGEQDSGLELLSALAEAAAEENRAVSIQSYMLLAVTAIHRQQPEQAERYIAVGMRLAAVGRDALELAVFQRLRGGCFSLRGQYDKSRYYLQDAQDALESLPRTAAVRLQLAGLYCDFGKVCRIRREYAESRGYFRQALSLLGGEAWPGGVWVYVHYGRMAYVLEDYGRARELFERGLAAAKASGEPWGTAAAAAYVSWCRAREDDWDAAAEALSFARACIARLGSPLEEVIVNYASMLIRSRMDSLHLCCEALENLLPYSPESYARQGIRRGSGTPDVFETEQMALGLREGINARRGYRVSDLYSKNKHFMAE